MLKLKFIGRGSCFNIEEGTNSAYIKEGNTLVLFDCGCTTFAAIKKSNLLKDIKKVYIFITHFHDDHAGSLGSLILYCRYTLGFKPTIFFKDKDYLAGFLAYQGAIVGKSYDVFTEYGYGIEIKELNLKITAVETSHYEYYKPVEKYYESKDEEIELENYFKCYGYYIVKYNDNKSVDNIYYSGDSNFLPKPVLNGIFAKSNAKLYQDTCLPDYEGNGHMSIERLCRLIPQEFRHQVYCMHIDNPELIEKCKDEGFNVVDCEV